MDLLLKLGHPLTGKDVAEVAQRALRPDRIDRDDAGEGSERKEQGSRGRRIPHCGLPSSFAAAISPAGRKGHGEKMIFF